MKRYNTILVLCFFLLINCKKEHKTPIEIKLYNDALYYAAIFETPKNSSDHELRSSLYNRYSNKEDWKKSLNKIKFEITNNTTNKLFIISESLISERLFENTHPNLSKIYIQIKNDKNEDLRLIGGISDSFKPSTKQEREQFKKDSVAIANTIYNSYYDEKRLSNYKVLNPNQSIILTSKLSLPIPIDYSDVLDTNLGIPMYRNKSYKFKLHYIINKKDIENNLPKHILDSLKKENIVIKDILLSSRTINIFPKK